VPPATAAPTGVPPSLAEIEDRLRSARDEIAAEADGDTAGTTTDGPVDPEHGTPPVPPDRKPEP